MAWSSSICAAILLASAGCGEPKYPPTSTYVYCTSTVPDCSQQADRECPNGYRQLDTVKWNTSTPGYKGIPGHTIRHEKRVIDCKAPKNAEPAADAG
jgi:hypothetical protein